MGADLPSAWGEDSRGQALIAKDQEVGGDSQHCGKRDLRKLLLNKGVVLPGGGLVKPEPSGSFP